MAGPTSPSAEGPTYAPPNLPAGWIAQWDGASKKYYFVQLATGASQWDIPTEAAQTGNTPLQPIEHPYGTPQPELITHPDGSQTVKHADGTLEPILSDGTRAGPDGATGDRGLGSMAMNALLGGKNSGHGGGGGQSSGLSGLANQFLGGGHGGGHGGGGKNPAGKLVGQLASSLLSPSNKPEQPQNYHGGQSNQNHPQGGLAGAVMGGVANMFGGKPGHGGNNGQNYGYSHSGAGGGYSGQAPTYNPPGSSGHTPSAQPPGSAQSYHSPPPNQHQAQHNQYPPPPPSGSSHQSYPPPPSGSYPPPPPGQPPHGQSYGTPSYPHSPAPPGGPHGDSYAQGQGYGAPPGGQNQYPPPPSGYNAQYSGGPGGPPQYGGQPQYQGGPPPVPHGSHPHQGQGYGAPQY